MPNLAATPVRIALVPLDERPVNTRIPAMIGAIGGASVALPPAEILGVQRLAADTHAVAQWLRSLTVTGAVDAAAVSADMLAYGNLIAARISPDSAITAMSRLSVLAEVGAQIPTHVFSLITRVANADNDVEEPLYWKQWGTRMYAFGALTHHDRTQGLPPADRRRLDDLAATLPPALVSDWLTRRLRNHAVNLALVDLAARGRIASLLLTSDDTAPFGLPTRERDWLSAWVRMLGTPADAVRMYPGADEVGSALIARLINAEADTRPKVWVEYSVAGDDALVAPYEDRPVRETVVAQIEACGCTAAVSPSDCDFVLGVATPSPRRADYNPDFLDEDRLLRGGAYDAFLAELAGLARDGAPIALADVAYPNGSDPLLTEKLFAGVGGLSAAALCAYGAWNTAGNTLGTVVAQASCALRIGADPQRRRAQRRFLAHRFVEDYGYQQRVRRQARAEALARWGAADPDPHQLDRVEALCSYIEDRLGEVLSELRRSGIGEGLLIAPGSVRLPWKRTFEVDFDLVDA